MVREHSADPRVWPGPIECQEVKGRNTWRQGLSSSEDFSPSRSWMSLTFLFYINETQVIKIDNTYFNQEHVLNVINSA